MKGNRTILVSLVAAVVAGFSVLAVGCTNNSDTTSASASPAAGSTNVPATANQAAQGQQQMGQQMGQDNASKAAAWRAAQAKAGGH